MSEEIKKNEISEEELDEVSGGPLGVNSGFSEKEPGTTAARSSGKTIGEKGGKTMNEEIKKPEEIQENEEKEAEINDEELENVAGGVRYQPVK